MLVEQALPQPPQWATVFVVLTSHPLVSLFVSQSAKPALHVPLQTPPAHVGVGMLFALHELVHPPHEVGLEAVFTSQPLVSLLLSQSVQPDWHDPLQEPMAQDGTGT